MLGSSQEQQQQQQQQPHDQPGNDESPTNRPAAPMPANGYEAVRIVGVLGNSREQQRPQPARRQVRVPLANRQPSPLPFNSYEEMRVTTGLDNAPQQPSIPLAPPVENTDAPYSYIETTQSQLLNYCWACMHLLAIATDECHSIYLKMGRDHREALQYLRPPHC